MIITSDVDKISQSGVLPCAISDHNVIFCTRKIKRYQCNKHNVTQIRSMKNYSVDTFVEKLNEIDWWIVLNEENIDSAWNKFSTLFLEIIDNIAPIKTVRLKQNCESWFSGDILESISKRDKAWTRFCKSKLVSDYSEYKMFRNKTQTLIRNSKKDFIKNEIAENRNSPKNLWKTLKNLGMPSQSKGRSANIGLRNDSEEISFDSTFVADKFNNFFCNIASKLVNKLTKREFNENEILDYYKKQNVKLDNFKFTVVTEAEVEKLLKGLAITKSTGSDNISARFR